MALNSLSSYSEARPTNSSWELQVVTPRMQAGRSYEISLCVCIAQKLFFFGIKQTWELMLATDFLKKKVPILANNPVIQYTLSYSVVSALIKIS